MRTPCTDCKDPKDRRRRVRLHFETIGGMRVYREADDRKVYMALCPSCRHTFQIDGGKA